MRPSVKSEENNQKVQSKNQELIQSELRELLDMMRELAVLEMQFLTKKLCDNISKNLKTQLEGNGNKGTN